MPDRERGVALARTMIGLGARRGCRVVAVLTAMDRPLGRACGNALETEEAIHALRGEGPPDLMEVTYALGGEMLMLGGVASDDADARARMERAISDGSAASKFQAIIEAQGGNPGVVDDPGVLPQSAECEIVTATRAGFVASVDPRAVGRAITALGGGRIAVDDKIDPSVGFVITAKPGDYVRSGEPIATVFARDPHGVAEGTTALRRAITIADEAAMPLPLVIERVIREAVERPRADSS